MPIIIKINFYYNLEPSKVHYQLIIVSTHTWNINKNIILKFIQFIKSILDNLSDNI